MPEITTTGYCLRDEGVYCGREHPRFPDGSIYGNPYSKSKYPELTVEQRIALFEKYFHAPEQAWLRKKAEEELTGKKLLCWCKKENIDAPCHVDIIASYLNKLTHKNS